MAHRLRYQKRDTISHLMALGLSNYALMYKNHFFESPHHVKPLSALLDELDEVARRNERADKHVFIHGVDGNDHDLVLIGPSEKPLTDELRAAGHDPAAVVKVDPEHIEIWIRLGEPVNQVTRRTIAEYLNWFYGVSYQPEDAPRWGYLAGFECRAYEDRLRNGHYPLVQLLEASGAVAPRGRALIQAAGELKAEMRAAIDRDLFMLEEAERTYYEEQELIRELSCIFVKAYEGQGVNMRNEIDRIHVTNAFDHDVDRDLVVKALTCAATRKGSSARAYAEETVAAVYDLVSDDPFPDLGPS